MDANGPQPDWSIKDVFTTGEAAEVCRVSQQTIIRCFDSGRLTGFKVPGSRFRRIPRDELIRFMRANNIPTEALDTASVIRVLAAASDTKLHDASRAAIAGDVALRDRCELIVAADALEAGMLAASRQPAIIILGEVAGLNLAAAVQRFAAMPTSPQIICVLAAMTDASSSLLRAAGAAYVVTLDRREHLASAIGSLARARVSENGR